MRAALIRQHGGPEVLEFVTDHPMPVPGPGEVRLKVAACALNYHDVFTRRGMPGIKVPLPVVIGIDIAGTVDALGEGVAGWSTGDPVLLNPITRRGLVGEMMDGGLAEYCVVPAENLLRIPEGVSFAQAAALPVAYGTAHRMMVKRGAIKAGERVLILGASGGVGTCCVMLARDAGAHVIACASSEEKGRRLLEIGAHEVINYAETDFMKEVWARHGKPARRGPDAGVHVVVNFTGGETWVPSLRVLCRGGRLLTCGATAGFDPKEDIRFIWSFELDVKGSNGWDTDDLHSLLEMVRTGRLNPVIDARLPLSEAKEALRLIEDREVFGKVIVEP